MVTTGSVVVAAGWQLLGIAKPKRAQCHLAVSIAFSMVTLYGNVLARRGVRQAVSGARKNSFLLSKAYPVLYKVFLWMYKALLPLSIMSLTDRAIPASGTFSKLPVPTSSRLLVSSKASRRSYRLRRAVKRLPHSSRRPCG